VFFLENRVKIFDTTLRDGEQTPGIAWTLEQKLQIAKQLDSLGVDVIEAGFPAVSASEIELFQKLKTAGIKAELCALARPIASDIQKVLESGAGRVNIFTPCSKLQSDAMKIGRAKNAVETLKSVEFASSKGLKVEVTLMDAARADFSFLAKFSRLLERRGVSMITLSDTVGSLDAFQTRHLFRRMSRIVKIPLSIHVHNDRGMATANSLAAVRGGASQVHVTVAGLGDRAGNASLEEVVLNLHDQLHLQTGINVKKLGPSVYRIARIGKFEIFKGKPIVGGRAVSHASALHATALGAFEAFPPERVGLKRSIRYGKMSGTSAVQALARKTGLKLSEVEVKNIVAKLKTEGNKGMLFRQSAVIRLIKEEAIRAGQIVNPAVIKRNLRKAARVK